MGAGTSANQTALYAQVPAEQIGTASGLLRTWGYLGSIASSAILSITFHNGVSDHGLHVIAVVMITVSALSVIPTVAGRRLMRTKSADR
jgi:sugar phosphate permease